MKPGNKYAKVILLALLACVGFPGLCQEEAIFLQESNGIVRVKVNQVFTLKMEACHDCGAHWSLEPADTAKIRLLGVTSKPVNPKFCVGGNVYEFWKFRVTEAGDYILNFNYGRPWEKTFWNSREVELKVE